MRPMSRSGYIMPAEARHGVEGELLIMSAQLQVTLEKSLGNSLLIQTTSRLETWRMKYVLQCVMSKLRDLSCEP